MNRRWLRIPFVVFALVVVVWTLAERRPEKLYLIALIALIGVAVVVVGWLFANRQRR
jgi:uncharacterized membrane protein